MLRAACAAYGDGGLHADAVPSGEPVAAADEPDHEPDATSGIAREVEAVDEAADLEEDEPRVDVV